MFQKLKKLLLPTFFVAMSCASKQYVVSTYHSSYTRISDSIQGNAQMAAFLQGYKSGLDSVMNEVIGYTEVPLTKAQPESTMGNFVADAQLEAGKRLDNLTSISVVNYGGLRIPFISKGNITKGKIYELMPFDNMLTIIDVPGKVLQQFCDHMAARKGWPVSGIQYVIKGGKAEQVMVNGSPIKENAVYKLVTSDYIANGGDECEFLVPLKKHYSTIFLRDALMEKIIKDSDSGMGLQAKLENRVSYGE